MNFEPSTPKPTKIVAEIGVNHNGSLDTAIDLVDAAKSAGANSVKLQYFTTSKLVNQATPTAQYQLASTGMRNMSDLLSQYELSEMEVSRIHKHCQNIGVGFSMSVFSVEDLEFVEKLDLDFLKIASGEITNVPLLLGASDSRFEIVLSTGMSNNREVHNAVSTILETGFPTEKLTIAHCTSAYPAPKSQIDLRVLQDWSNRYDCKVGYSDHTLGHEIAVAAVALGASFIEKHITLDRASVGPDHRASLEPREFREMVESIRHVEEALGRYEKRVQDCEVGNRKLARKAIYATKEIQKGDQFSEEALTTRRPLEGLGAEQWSVILLRRAKRHYKVGDALSDEEIA